MTELLSYSFIYNSLHNDNNDLNCNFDPRLIYVSINNEAKPLIDSIG